MAKYNLTRISPKGFLHSQAFLEIRDSLAWSLSALDHETMCTDNSFSAGQSTNIIFGAELLPPTTILPYNSIVYNLEQPTHPSIDNIQKIVKQSSCRVWDYNFHNVEQWQSHGIPAQHLPIGYTPNLTRIPKSPIQDIDCLFYGWLTPRRSKMIQELRSADLNVVATDSCYGGGRDQLISRSKLVLNINHDGRDLFNIARVSFLLANSKCVVSEQSSDMNDYAWLLETICWCSLSEMVEACLDLVSANPTVSRENLEQSALYSISHMDFTESVAAVLDSVNTFFPAPQAPTLIRSRYELGCREGDMVDFLPWLREHAKGQILEIGTRDGASTSAFLLGLEENDPTGRLTSIDIDDCSGLWTHPQWTFHRSNSLTINFPDSSFDIALIDGDHKRDAYIGDLYNCYHWVRPGGLILTHDIRPERGHEFYSVGIKEEFYKFCSSHPDITHYELPGRYGMGVMRKPE